MPQDLNHDIQEAAQILYVSVGTEGVVCLEPVSHYTLVHVSHQYNSKKISDLNLTLIRGAQRGRHKKAV